MGIHRPKKDIRACCAIQKKKLLVALYDLRKEVKPKSKVLKVTYKIYHTVAVGIVLRKTRGSNPSNLGKTLIVIHFLTNATDDVPTATQKTLLSHNLC